ncbi:MAG: nucleotide exchange factor GrpE [Firmicutes bacterium]|nr:nucleotide exchange factor GrpE [Bacillota bacterium]
MAENEKKITADEVEEIENAEASAQAEEVVPDADQQPDPLEALQADLDNTKDMLMRTAAEFDNYKKRTERERTQLTEYIKASTVKPLLPVLDNIARAGGGDTDPSEYTKGLEMIIKQVAAAAEQMGIKAIEAEGKPFDPTVHEAVMHIEDESLGENTVAEVLQAGYMLGDTVLRPAMVKVAN